MWHPSLHQGRKRLSDPQKRAESPVAKKGYSGRDIEIQLERVDTMKRSDLFDGKRKYKKEERVPLVLTYSRHLPDIHKIVRRHLHVLHRSDRMAKVFPIPPIVAYRRDKNLCDFLVRGKTNRALKY